MKSKSGIASPFQSGGLVTNLPDRRCDRTGVVGIGDDELEKTVIGTLGSLDRPSDPAGKGYLAMVRHFSGITDTDRQAFRDRVLAMTPAGLLKAVRDVLVPALDASSVAVYAGQDRLARARAAAVPTLTIEPLMG